MKNIKDDKLICWYDAEFDNGRKDVVWITFAKMYMKNSENNLIGPGVTICICDEHHVKGHYTTLGRIDATWCEIRQNEIKKSYACIWDGDGFKNYTLLKTNIFNSDSLSDILKYIDYLCNIVRLERKPKIKNIIPDIEKYDYDLAIKHDYMNKLIDDLGQ